MTPIALRPAPRRAAAAPPFKEGIANMRASSLIFCGAAAAAFVGMAPSAHAQDTYPLSGGIYPLRTGTPASVGLSSVLLDQAVNELEDAVDDGDINGAVLLVARRG